MVWLRYVVFVSLFFIMPFCKILLYVVIKISALQWTRIRVKELSLSSAARHIDFHLLRLIYVALVALSIAHTLHLFIEIVLNF